MNLNRCCILYNKPGENALADELDVLDQVDYIGTSLDEIGIKAYRKGITSDFMTEIEELSGTRPDFVFNLVESIDNKGELCYFIPSLLNMHGIPYSGNPVEAMFITTSKALTGKLLRSNGIKNPGSFSPSQYKKLKTGNRYIIKPVWEDGSAGITAKSVFTFSEDLVPGLLEHKDTHWIIEDYIEGREFNISLLAGDKGVEVLPPAEIIFHNYERNRPRIVDFKSKWEPGSFEYENTIREFPGRDLDPVIKRRITTVAKKCWQVFGLKGYARVDMRTDENDIPNIIEVNANPCISPDSGFVAATREAGLTFTTVVRRIISDLNI